MPPDIQIEQCPQRIIIFNTIYIYSTSQLQALRAQIAVCVEFCMFFLSVWVSSGFSDFLPPLNDLWTQHRTSKVHFCLKWHPGNKDGFNSYAVARSLPVNGPIFIQYLEQLNTSHEENIIIILSSCLQSHATLLKLVTFTYIMVTMVTRRLTTCINFT